MMIKNSEGIALFLLYLLDRVSLSSGYTLILGSVDSISLSSVGAHTVFPASNKEKPFSRMQNLDQPGFTQRSRIVSFPR